MKTGQHLTRVAMTACIVALTSLSGLCAAQSNSERRDAGTSPTRTAAAPKQEAAADKHVNDAIGVVGRLNSEPRMKTLLQEAKGVLVVPTFGRAALGVGASGGAGVLLVKREDGAWSDPAFYNIGSLSAGAQAGGEAGAIVMVLNTEKAVGRFMRKNNFSLSADAGLTVINWSKVAQDTIGTGDVVVWVGTKGLFGNVATIAINDIRFNQNLTNAYYHQTVGARDVIAGKFSNPQADSLKQALAATSSGTMSGTSSSGSGEAGMSDTKK